MSFGVARFAVVMFAVVRFAVVMVMPPKLNAEGRMRGGRWCGLL
jgi:hypothetical protein